MLKLKKSWPELAKVYAALLPYEQKILQVLSIIYEPCNTYPLYKVLKRLNSKTSDVPPTINSLQKMVDSLRQKDLLVGEKPRCNPVGVEEFTRMAAESGEFKDMIRAVEAEFPPSLWDMINGPERCLREIRIGIYIHNVYQTFNYLDAGRKSFPDFFTYQRIFSLICNNPFRPGWFNQLPSLIKAAALDEIIHQAIYDLTSPAPFLKVLTENQTISPKEGGSIVRNALATLNLFMGQAEEIADLTRDTSQYLDQNELLGCYHFLLGHNDLALEHFQASLKLYRKLSGKKKIFLQEISGLFFILALLKSKTPALLKQALEYCNEIESKPSLYRFLYIYRYLKGALYLQQNQILEAQKYLIFFSTPSSSLKSPEMSELESLPSEYADLHSPDSLSIFFSLLTRYWLQHKLETKDIASLTDLLARSTNSGYLWFSHECANLLSAIYPNDLSYRNMADDLFRQTGLHSIIDLISPKEPWERSLEALSNLGQKVEEKEVCLEAQSRLIWLLAFHDDFINFYPREQKLGKDGLWSRGRSIALSRLYLRKNLSFITSSDEQILSTLGMEKDYWSTNYSFEWKKTIMAMIGHPLLFLYESPDVHIDLSRGQLDLLVKQEGEQFIMTFPETIANKDIMVVREGLSKYKVIELTPEHQKIGQLLGENGLSVPAIAKDKVLKVMNNLTSFVSIQSTLADKIENIEEVTADSTIYVHLLPVGSGFRLEILVKPFAMGGPYCKPGLGGETIVTEINGQHYQTRRNLQQEKKKVKEVVDGCSLLSTLSEFNLEWSIDGLEDCLEILGDLQKIENIVVEWPEGEKIRVSRPVSFEQLHLHIKRDRDWFALEGKLQVDEKQVMEMRELLEFMEEGTSRFIPLGEGQFLALTNELRQRLSELKAFSEKTAKELRVHPLASLALRDFTESVGSLETDDNWKEFIQRIDQAQTLEAKVPSTFQAQLRDYQLEGYQWLAQLALWGVGACLADDMGLGKTIQALAIILDRAASGPTLIVAPTSVCANWADETERFAPTLKIQQFGNKDRAELLNSLKAYDMLIISYTILQMEAEILSNFEWQTIVLDEAQAIKNITTKRSQAAMNLQAGFRLITTGTPIENHLGELWNLFRFINPGLLGSLEKFNQRFASPIEKFHDKEAKKNLKKLIQPFILRRIKSQVLDELPSRTEITLHVEMSKEEAAFYEALRQKALDRLEQSQGPPGARHLQILAEIMKLRRACCHPQLVDPAIKLEGSKLAVLSEVLDELLDNNHKALVFSQFVDHLSIIREFLDKKGIFYQYLDGSTPAKDRKIRVDAFQGGQGDLFLISLKAGGLGMNLTAADYVIHMDPWWNPAVEDQASDRAHRIGQHRPVTIYRLVTKHTIEEKIVTLHRDKRDLATTLLEGSDLSGKMSADELLHLIREDF